MFYICKNNELPHTAQYLISGICPGISGFRCRHRLSEASCGRYPAGRAFGIALGFGDKTIGEVCLDSGVDTATFLAVVNMHSDDKAPDPESISVLRSSATCAIRMSISSISGFRPSAAS